MRRRPARPGLPLLIMIVGLLPGRAARADSPKLAASWQSRAGAPGLAAGSIAIALRAYRRAQEQKLVRRERLTIVDYSLPSTEPRLWVLDPESGEVLFAERVAHGRGSGDLLATRFGNRPESHRSSLGVFRTAETYTGAHGYSLRLDGLEKGINDRAREREIVFHSADYATEAFGREHGYLGRSYGCLALAPAVSHALIDEIRGGSIVVALGNEQRGEVGSR